MERKKADLCLKLFLKFLKIGAFTFGGGYAMIPLIRREIALREGWIEDKDILDILAVSESTPGPIAVNTATFVGYRLAGPWGAAAATVGVVLPSFVIIFVLSFVLRQFEELPAVRYAFWGIRVAVVALVCSALVSIVAADTRVVNGQTLGSMLLALPEDEAAAQRAIEYIRAYPGLSFEEVDPA